MSDTTFVLANMACNHDGACFRRNTQHFMDVCHPIEQTKPKCPLLLSFKECVPHKCHRFCAPGCPKKAASDAHMKQFYHGPSSAQLQAHATLLDRGIDPTTVRTTTTTTTTTSSTTTTTMVVQSAPKRVCGGGKLREDFVVPPFSVLDAGQGPWQTRKKEWFALGIDSGEGRDEDLLGAGLRALTPSLTGTSIFDPTLAECAYKWYCPRPVEGGPPVRVADPFAGGSCRGIVAAKLGLAYLGTDVSARQVEANRRQAAIVCVDCPYQPTWVVADGEDIEQHFRDKFGATAQADFMLMCPPYFDLEVYDAGPNDLSTLPSYEAFLTKYERILANATRLLKHQRVAVTVVGNLRDATGQLLDFHGDTKRLLGTHGNVLYVDAVLKTALASAPARAGRQMRAASKLVGVHQNVIVTCRGSPLTPAACRAIGIAAADM